MIAHGDSVRIGAVAIHYLRWGEGSPSLLLLHGASHCAGIWSPLAERLAADGYTVVAADLRGHGASDKPEAGYGWQQMRDDIIGLIDSLNLSELVLAGHSRGSGVSLLTAATVPNRIRGVFVYEPTMPLPSAPDHAPSGRRISQMAERALARRSVFPGREELLAHWRRRDAFRKWDERYVRAYVDYGTVDREDGAIELCCPPRVEALLYEALADPGPWSELNAPDVPSLQCSAPTAAACVRERIQPLVYGACFPDANRLSCRARHTSAPWSIRKPSTRHCADSWTRTFQAVALSDAELDVASD